MLTGVIFCDGDSFVADEIKDTTGEPDSHVALLFGDTVLHFRFLGFESMHIAEFRECYTISDILSAPKEIMVSPEAVIKHYHGKAYDFLGMIYVGVYLVLRDKFNIVLPGGNSWQNRRQRFCVTFASEITCGERLAMLSPTKFKKYLLGKGWKAVRKSP